MQAPNTCSCYMDAHLEAGAGHHTRLLAHCSQLVQGHGGEADEAQQLSQVALPRRLYPHPLEHSAEHVVLAPAPQGVAAQQLAQRGEPAGVGQVATVCGKGGTGQACVKGGTGQACVKVGTGQAWTAVGGVPSKAAGADQAVHQDALTGYRQVSA